MTEQEAIKEIKSYIPKDNNYNIEDRRAFNMAIEALKFQSEYKDIVDCFIQRVEVKDGKPLKGYRILTNEDTIKYDELREKDTSKKVKKEQWIDTKCSCGYCFSKDYEDGYYSIPYESMTNYCPNCGQKLDWSEEE